MICFSLNNYLYNNIQDYKKSVFYKTDMFIMEPIVIAYEKLYSDLQFTLAKDEEKLIVIDGQTAYVSIKTKIDENASYEIKKSISSTEFIDSLPTIDAIEFQKIQIGLLLFSSFSSNIAIDILSPNFLYFKNTSLANKNVVFYLRGNR